MVCRLGRESGIIAATTAPCIRSSSQRCSENNLVLLYDSQRYYSCSTSQKKQHIRVTKTQKQSERITRREENERTHAFLGAAMAQFSQHPPTMHRGALVSGFLPSPRCVDSLDLSTHPSGGCARRAAAKHRYWNADGKLLHGPPFFY